jgi:2-keto-3-deoxy-L-rhamnonate aldolase RhmA
MAFSGLKGMAEQRELKLGSFIVEFATPGIGHILKSAGCDFVLFDCEHSGFGFETVKNALRYFEAAQLPAIVRVPSQAYDHIARAADMGAEGIMVPMVGTAEEAQRIVNSAKYVPLGRRGAAFGIAHDQYRPGPVADKLTTANRRMTIFTQIETAEGVENCEAIAAIDGVDCLWIGHFDLSCSLGIPADFQNKKFQDAVKTVAEACRNNGKSLGRLVPDAATGVELYGSGHDFICYAGDVWLLEAAIRQGLDAIRSEVAAAGRSKPGKATAPEAPKSAKRGKGKG